MWTGVPAAKQLWRLADYAGLSHHDDRRRRNVRRRDFLGHDGLRGRLGRGVMIAELVGPPARPGRLIGPQRPCLSAHRVRGGRGCSSLGSGSLAWSISLRSAAIRRLTAVRARSASSAVRFSGRGGDPGFLVESAVMTVGEQPGDLAATGRAGLVPGIARSGHRAWLGTRRRAHRRPRGSAAR